MVKRIYIFFTFHGEIFVARAVCEKSLHIINRQFKRKCENSG